MNPVAAVAVFLGACTIGWLAWKTIEDGRVCWACQNRWRVRDDGLCVTCAARLTGPAETRERT